MSTAALSSEQLHERADDFVSRLDRAERVVWLQRHQVSDRQILDALLDPEDAELDEFTREVAHELAAEFANNPGQELPPWLS